MCIINVLHFPSLQVLINVNKTKKIINVLKWFYVAKYCFITHKPRCCWNLIESYWTHFCLFLSCCRMKKKTDDKNQAYVINDNNNFFWKNAPIWYHPIGWYVFIFLLIYQFFLFNLKGKDFYNNINWSLFFKL